MNKYKIALLVFSMLVGSSSYSQTDEDVIKDIYKHSLTQGKSYDWLNHLSNQIGSRLSGSLGAEKAVSWGKEELEKLGLDEVWLQPVMVPKWVRGAKEYAFIESEPGKTTTVNICALGGSVATPALGIKANVVEIHNFEELEALGKEQIEGKIVFYNRPMQADLIQTFQAYGGCVNQRYLGAVEASKYGAVAVIVRSMNLRLDDLPHTGSMTYNDIPVEKRIPSAAISTNDAELLSTMLELDKHVKFYFKQNCKQLKDVQSYNVIGEITGSEFPNEYMVVGGHLDSWDLGDGSHDDGAGIVQSMEVLRLFKQLGIKPKRSIRVVLFMNEENGLRGGNKYAEDAKLKGENHVFALESDSGGFTPRGFSFDCSEANFNQVLTWQPLFKPYLIHYFEKGGSGADVGPLKNDTNVLAGLRPDSQRYFDYHHASNDTFDAINKRELELGAATMASLMYLFDKYGVNF
ncbi:MAG: M20/M25/M40 family metallo-hydrolase [Flavobacteriales bacterium]|nr:M20/M25/M40 family metallo-hydrolase [Flavobacteriales bacterium]PIV93496.1 MAG: peptidase M28 family protein [Flavobacteriaceae bacterium CG17_big_fil_post_rev_8_21_14_2_50_33_15]PIY10551.1 MAG: peptidase M28 family protein [Flavobacteriaceae bacterium CG_4_10_14_3_um_filter_33_47]PJB17965.1 MAG: peptidase M28 family protein [Flavobacteriaceae bacterium CG_4_9_14_3_um_filter_33_16]NCP51777.1 M20/M25/M40 family metallo-hydrolase [Flavobacteriales bacterium]